MPDAEKARLRSQCYRLIVERDEAESRAIDSLSRYKFAMFGYWAGIWVHLNRLIGDGRRNPFAGLVRTAREIKGGS